MLYTSALLRFLQKLTKVCVCVHGMYWVLTKAHITLTYYMPKVLEGIHLINLHVRFGSSCHTNQTLLPST